MLKVLLCTRMMIFDQCNGTIGYGNVGAGNISSVQETSTVTCWLCAVVRRQLVRRNVAVRSRVRVLRYACLACWKSTWAWC
ncbi:unnamed protein product [Sphacelaria rigidula]